MISQELKVILNYIHQMRGLDFSGYRPSMLERRIIKRCLATRRESYDDYFIYLKNNLAEVDHLIDVLTIKVSKFFRDTLPFEYLSHKILPAILASKMQKGDYSLRVWSAGCAGGEEPYSVAILIREWLKKESLQIFSPFILATDIDEKTLKKAKEAVYHFESIEDIKHHLLIKYFIPQGELFALKPEIKKMVNFSSYNILDEKSYTPPESIFGHFDLVFCRNLLIYFTNKWQDIIFSKLYRSLVDEGYLVLGESEGPTTGYKDYFQFSSGNCCPPQCCHIYQKKSI